MGSKHGESNQTISWGKIIVAILIITIIVAGAFFLVKNQNQSNTTSKVKTSDERLVSAWTTDGITVYEFENNGNGTLKLPSSEYKFTYVLNDNKMYIDFESDKAVDSNYEYSFENDKLILKGINSTAGTYTFTKK